MIVSQFDFYCPRSVFHLLAIVRGQKHQARTQLVSSVLSGQLSATCDVIGSFQNGGRRTADQE